MCILDDSLEQNHSCNYTGSPPLLPKQLGGLLGGAAAEAGVSLAVRLLFPWDVHSAPGALVSFYKLEPQPSALRA